MLVGVEGLLVFDKRAGEVALGYKLLAAQDGDADGEVGGGLEEPLLGVEGDAARTAEGFYGVGGVGPGDVDLAFFGFAVGLDAKLDGHAEEVEVLGDGSDGAETLVVAETIDGVLIVELGGTGAVDPLGEEGGKLELGLLLGDGFKIAAANAFVGILRKQVADELGEGVVAHLPAEHVEDHGSLFKGHGLELGAEGVDAAEGGEGIGVVGQGLRRRRP